MKEKDLRLAALQRFAAAITALNIAGHFFLGFEQSVAHMLVALLSAYVIETSFEILQAKAERRPLRFTIGIKSYINFLLPSHITAMAVSMLIFTNEPFTPVIFATAVALLSKVLLRVRINGIPRHFLNPSNTGIAITLLVFPSVGIAQPYQFTENVTGWVDLLLPLIFIGLGSFLNYKFTRKIPLIVAWLGGFIVQACLRGFIFSENTLSTLLPMTGVAFLLFTFYMISDPVTSPTQTRNQVIFGFSVAVVYGLLVSLHVVFGLFFALFVVCSARGAYLFATSLQLTFRNASTNAPVVSRESNMLVDGQANK